MSVLAANSQIAEAVFLVGLVEAENTHKGKTANVRLVFVAGDDKGVFTKRQRWRAPLTEGSDNVPLVNLVPALETKDRLRKLLWLDANAVVNNVYSGRT